MGWKKRALDAEDKVVVLEAFTGALIEMMFQDEQRHRRVREEVQQLRNERIDLMARLNLIGVAQDPTTKVSLGENNNVLVEPGEFSAKTARAVFARTPLDFR